MTNVRLYLSDVDWSESMRISVMQKQQMKTKNQEGVLIFSFQTYFLYLTIKSIFKTLKVQVIHY